MRLLVSLALAVAAVFSAYVFVVCVVKGSRGSDPGIYWSAVALIGGLALVFATVSAWLWRGHRRAMAAAS